jgi:cyclic pyranopterin phosphate synthase
MQSTSESTAGPSRYFSIPGQRSKIGFISPMSHNFCADCNRVRMTVEGRLLLCLGNEHSSDLRQILRADNQQYLLKDELAQLEFSEENPVSVELKRAIVAAMDLKPERHHFYESDYAQPVRLMNMTGG